jgi:hypothetical protein
MLCLLLTSALSISLGQTPLSTPVDVSTLKVGAPAAVAELDLGKMKGELRQVAWSPDGSELYVQTFEGTPQQQKLRHFVVTAGGGPARAIEQPPSWAADYWGFKSDRFAPGLRSIMIEFEQKLEKTKIGTGTGRPGDQALGAGVGGSVDVEKTAEGQQQNVARLTLFGETISEFVNEMPIPGLMFSWGPVASGAIAYTDRGSGHLTLLDQHKHKQAVAGVKDALLPAWSIDGGSLAWVQKSGRKKYTLFKASVSRG